MNAGESEFVFPLADETASAPTADHGVAPDERVESFVRGDAMELRTARDGEWLASTHPIPVVRDHR